MRSLLLLLEELVGSKLARGEGTVPVALLVAVGSPVLELIDVRLCSARGISANGIALVSSGV